MVSLTVDGRVIEAPAGAPLVEVLKQNGFYTSSLCYIDGLKPYAGCRTCLVDIKGPPGLQLSCTAVVQEGMEVITASDEVKEARRAVLSIILANHSDRCLTCHRREHCHPGDICLRDDVVTHRCLTCSKNYRCELQATCEMVGMSGYEPWVGEERSFYQTPQPPADRANPFMEFDPQMCIICTRCQRACEEKRHTGAITLSGRGWDTQIAFGAGGAIHESNCDFSGACIDVCPTAALMEHPNKWVAKPDTWTTTTCDSCAIGCAIRLGSKDGRGVIVRPAVDGNPVSGDQICVRGRYHYDTLKPRERLSRHLVRRGAIHVPAKFDDAVAEAARLLREAAGRGRVGVLVGGTVTNEEAYLAQAIARQAFGAAADSSLGPVARAVRGALEARLGAPLAAGDMTRIRSSKAIVVVHDDLEESHNVASVRVKDAAVHHRATVVVIGALRSELVDFAACWLRPPAGEEGQWAAALADAIAGGAPLNEEIAAAARLLAAAPRDETMVVCAPNPVSPALAGAMAGGAANIAVALFGGDAAEHLVVLPAEVNVYGLLDQGVAVHGGPDPLAGLAGLLVVRDDPTMRLPGAGAAIERIGTVVVLDNVLHETAKRASVVIAEGRAYASQGTYTQGDFRVQKLAPAVRPEGEAVPLFEALSALAGALGVAAPATPDDALGAIARDDPRYQPAHDLLIGQGVRLSVRGTGSGTLVPVPPALVADDGLRVITSRDLYTALDAAALRHPDAEKLHRYDRIQVSEEDGARLGLRDGDEVTIAAGDVAITAPVTVTERVPVGAVYVSSLLQGGAVSALFASDEMPGVELRLASAEVAQPVLAVAGAAGGTGIRARTMAPQHNAVGRGPNPVTRISGIGERFEVALDAQGIRTAGDLLAAGGTPEGRIRIAAALGVETSVVLEWVNRADLMRVEGIDERLSDLLENAGVDTVRELARRVPANLHAKLTEVAGGAQDVPSEQEVARWVSQAADLPPGISY
jgi:predicted molibdopterin-dependent oxidoreductase YjgC/predicted flap endonuclease-1-like 5' DNA nuclease